MATLAENCLFVIRGNTYKKETPRQKTGSNLCILTPRCTPTERGRSEYTKIYVVTKLPEAIFFKTWPVVVWMPSKRQ